jgi:hypothetical protein
MSFYFENISGLNSYFYQTEQPNNSRVCGIIVLDSGYLCINGPRIPQTNKETGWYNNAAVCVYSYTGIQKEINFST